MIYPSFLFSSSISGIGCQAIKKNNNSFSKQVKKVKRLKKRKNKNSSHDFSKPFYRTFLIETAIKAINESQGILKNKERRIKILQESLPEEEQCLPLEEEAEMIKATENKIEKTLKIDNSLRNRLRKKDVKLMKKKWKREKLSMLNKTKHSWVILKNNITTPTGETYNNIMTPAGKMKLGDSDIFSHSYNDEGISSGSICESEHAVNLWMSELTSTSGDVLFKGIRHGVLSPYGLDKNSQERKVGRVNRGKEVILAALYANQAILESAIQNPDEVVPLQLTSTSLVTAGNVWSVTEGDQLEDQIYSWNELSNKVIELEVVDKSGNCQKIKVKPEIIPFNFGVNELSLKFKIGQKKSDSINLEGLKILLGDGFCNSTDPQGWVGKYLADNPKNKSVVLQLVQQIKEIWEAKAHNTDESDPYKMARCIVLLTYEIGIIPAWNCKSGKDRTGFLDGEVKREVIKLHQNESVTPWGALGSEDQKLLQKVLLNSGNLQIQESNTGGAQGNKVCTKTPWMLSSAELSLKRKRIGDRDAWKKIKGLSNFVNS